MGKAVGAGGIAVMQGVIMLVIAPFVGVSLDWKIVLSLIPLLLILSICLSGLGLLIGARMRSQ